MDVKQPFYARTTFGHTVVGLIIALVGAVIFTPVGVLVTRRFFPENQSITSTKDHPTTPAAPSIAIEDKNTQSGKEQVTPPKESQAVEARVQMPNPEETMLNMEYESLTSRLSAVDESLTRRAHDLGELPVKPEIVSSVQTSRSDLAAARMELQNRDFHDAASRMERVRTALEYLESL